MQRHIVRIFAVLVVTLVSAVVFAQTVSYQETTDKRVFHLTNKILKRLPDARYTKRALGRGDVRYWRAMEHAAAIVKAADKHRATWQAMGLPHFNPEFDLAPLIAALTYRESSFRSIVRMDGGKIVAHVPIDAAKKKIERADFGVMQVRAPSRPAYACGVVKGSHVRRLLQDLDFSYDVGTCILSKRFSKSREMYKSSSFRRLRRDGRPRAELLFYGVYGPRRGTEAAARAQGLLPLERYNWGGKNLYMHRSHSGYARRIIKEYEFFKEGLETPLDT